MVSARPPAPGDRHTPLRVPSAADGAGVGHYGRVTPQSCERCASTVFAESLQCPVCSAPVGFHPPTLSFRVLDGETVEIDGRTWAACSNRDWRCNWLAPRDEPSAQCFSCRLTRRRPPSDETADLERLADAAVDKRRLLMQLRYLGLPITPYYEREGGLAFDLLAGTPSEPVMIGHANGVITIDLNETLDDRREGVRVRLGEAYRTMLGHFRHEIGHYYQGILVDSDAAWAECRALFGDERASYQDAIDRHYRFGAPEGWADSFISEYATMHPWEDFAECFAHYLHITGTLATAARGGVTLDAERVSGHSDASVVPLEDYSAQPIDRMLDDWHWLSLLFNRVNRTMGKDDLYPFRISAPVAEKLAYVHRIVTRVAGS